MSDPQTEIECRLSECLYYAAPGSKPNTALCGHAEAPRYVNYVLSNPCPLYRLDWQKKAAQAPNFGLNPGPRRRF